MKQIQRIEIEDTSREEILPDFVPEFPYIATCAELDRYAGRNAPWHWHRPVELFYIKSGSLAYTTPGGEKIFPAGTGGFVNSNVLHKSQVMPSGENTVEYLHLFDPVFLSGEHGSRLETKYILPLTASGVEIIALSPEQPDQARLLEKILEAFSVPEGQWGYEFTLRACLCQIWMELFAMAPLEQNDSGAIGDAQIKGLMVYIREHYPEPLCVEDLAGIAHISKRVCFRLFQEKLHMTPLEYLRSVRLDAACRLLAKTQISMTEIAGRCGLGSSSYFGKVFREQMGCTPRQYRMQWRNRDKK